MTAPAPKKMPSIAVLQQILLTSSDQLKLAMYIAVFAGLRVSEIAGLRWDDVGEFNLKVERQALLVDGKVIDVLTKTNSGVRSIPMNNELRDIFRIYRAKAKHEKYMFVDDAGNRLSARDFSTANRKFQLNSGLFRISASDFQKIPLYSFHKFRHACVALWLAEKGLEQATIARLIGHVSFAFTAETYGYIFEEDQTGLRLAA